VDKKTNKPQLHQSHLALLYRCGYKFSLVVLNGEREPQTTPLIIGTGTHAANAKNLQNKIDKGSLLDKSIVEDVARDSFLAAWDNSPVVLNEEEKFLGMKRAKGAAMDQTIDCSKAYHYDVAPNIQPISVEKKFVIEAQGYDYDFAGQIDVDEDKKTPDKETCPGETIIGDGIRDTKTRKTNLGQQEVDCSEQYTFYALYKWLESGKKKVPDFVAQDSIIKPTKTRAAYCVSHYSRREIKDFVVAFRRFNQACKIIRAGMFTPASPSDYLCTPEFCGFFASGRCPYVNKDRPLNKKPKKVKQEGWKDGRTKDDIIKGLTTAAKLNDD